MHETQTTQRPVTAPASLWPAWLVLAIGLLITWFAWLEDVAEERRYLQEEFERRSAAVHVRLDEQMQTYGLILRTTAAFFNASEKVTREEWQQFMDSLALGHSFPALQALAYARRTNLADLGETVRVARAAGATGFAVWPEGRRDQYVINYFTYPNTASNIRALGFDLWQEPLRREAMELTTTRGRETISGKLTLKIDEGSVPVPAVIMFYPVGADRQQGYILAPFRMPTLGESLLPPTSHNLVLNIYDGALPLPERLLYRSSQGMNRTTPAFSERRPINVAGRNWLLEIYSDDHFGNEFKSKHNTRLVIVAGTAISLLLFAISWSLATTRRRAERIADEMTANLRRSEARFRTLFSEAPLGVWLLDRDGRVVDCNAMFATYAGAPRERILGFNMLTEAQDRALEPSIRKALAGIPAMVETPYTSTTGNKTAIYRYHFSPIELADGQTLILGFAEDITERHAAEQRHLSIIDVAMDAFALVSRDGRILECNAAASGLTGYTQEEILQMAVPDLEAEETSEETAAHIRDIMRKGRDRFESRWRRKDGSVFDVEVTASYLSFSDEICAFVRDITLVKEHVRELDHIAHYDALTGVPNRTLLSDRMAQAVARTRREEMLMAVCYLDLDGFKPINDRYGHAMGDRLLVEVAERLKYCLRGSDTVARMGGDEFVLLLLDLQKTEECVAALERILEAVARPVVIADYELMVSASLGVAIFPHDDADMDTLLRHADQAMYLAKQSGRNRYHIFDPEHDRIARDRAEKLTRIQQALDDREFVLYYQPQVDMLRGQVMGAEALVRWQHPERGLLPPAEFLSMMEDTDLIVDLGDWVIASALKQIRQWHGAGLAVKVGVNIAARHLLRPDFVTRLQDHLAAHADVPPALLELEVVETAALDDVAHVSKVIGQCAELGVGFALDDFGTGYSSLTYLKSLPAHLLKIDQTFVRDMLADAEDRAIVEGVIGLARVFRRDVIAEGVETAAHGQLLLELGCVLGQGYGIARPMAAAEFDDWAKNWRGF